jgi:hypothetical protein
MEGDFWLAFVPLAIDVTPEKLQRVIATLEDRTNQEDFGDLIATMVVLARLNKNHPGLPDMIESLITKERSMLHWHPFYQRGEESGLEQGRREALMRLLERRLARSLTASEQRRVSTRIVKHGLDIVGDAILDLSRDELTAWLTPNGHRSKEHKGV